MTDEAPPSKLTITKQRWTGEHRFITGAPGTERLPPGQHVVRDWPVLDLGVQPRVSTEQWSLRIHGSVAHPATLTWPDWQAQPRLRSRSDIHCVTTWSRYDNEWEGVAAQTIVQSAGPQEGARFVLLHSADGYTTNLPIGDFASDGVVLADHWSGAPLSREHGGPVRLVVPHLYFWKSAKWLTRIEFRVDDVPGYWEERGYHDRGDPWQEQRYSED